MAGKSCTYNDKTYSDGSSCCQSGETHRCDDGNWTNLHYACEEADGDIMETHSESTKPSERNE